MPILEDLARLHRGVTLVGADRRIVWLSASLEEWFDTNAVRRWDDLFAHCRVGDDLWTELLAQGRLQDREAEVLTEAGSRRVRVTAARLAFGGEPGPVVAVFQDEAAAPAHAEPAPPDPGTFLAEVLEGAQEAAIGLDERGLMSCVNAAAERLLGQLRSSLVDRPLADLLARAEDAERLEKALAAREPTVLEAVELCGRDDAPLEVSLSLRWIRSPEGAELVCVAHARPIPRSDSVATLQRKNSELEHTLRAVSHDLRSPLVALLGFTRLVREDYGEILGEKGQHFMQRIEQAARTMETLIHDLLELSQIDRTRVDNSVVDPREVLRQIQSELKPRLDASGTRLEIPDDLPPLHCDRTRLYQVFSNLVGNAVEHMGNVADPTIRVTVTTEPDHHRLTVMDNGSGIDAEHQDRIFEIFHSVGPPSDDRRRTGVGLAIVKKIAETYGGRVWVESSPGRGAAFHVTLPRPLE